MIAALLLASTLVPQQVIAIEDLRKQMSAHYQRPVSLEGHISHRAFLSTVDKWDDQRVKRLLDTYGLILQEDREDGPLTLKRNPTQTAADRRARQELVKQLLEQLKAQNLEALKGLETFRDTPVEELYARIPALAAQVDRLAHDRTDEGVRKLRLVYEEWRQVGQIAFLKDRPYAATLLRGGLLERLDAADALWRHPTILAPVQTSDGEFLPRLRLQAMRDGVYLSLSAIKIAGKELPQVVGVSNSVELRAPSGKTLTESLISGGWDLQSSFEGPSFVKEPEPDDSPLPDVRFSWKEPQVSMIKALAGLADQANLKVLAEVVPPLDEVSIRAGEWTLKELAGKLPEWQIEFEHDVLWVRPRCPWLFSAAPYATTEMIEHLGELTPSVYGYSPLLSSMENYVDSVYRSKAVPWSRSPFNGSPSVFGVRFPEPRFELVWLWKAVSGGSTVPAEIPLASVPKRTLEQFLELRDVFSDQPRLYGADALEELRQSRILARESKRTIAKGHLEVEISLERPVRGWRWPIIRALQRKDGGGWSRMLESRVQPAVEW